MKATGVVRKIDNLGRVVAPKEIRNILNIKPFDPVEFYVGDDGEIIIKKYEPGCVFCGDIENTYTFKGKTLCEGCIGDLKKMQRGSELPVWDPSIKPYQRWEVE